MEWTLRCAFLSRDISDSIRDSIANPRVEDALFNVFLHVFILVRQGFPSGAEDELACYQTAVWREIKQVCYVTCMVETWPLTQLQSSSLRQPRQKNDITDLLNAGPIDDDNTDSEDDVDSAFNDQSDHDYDDEDHFDTLSDLSELTEDSGTCTDDEPYRGYLRCCQVWAAPLTHIFKPAKVSMYDYLAEHCG